MRVVVLVLVAVLFPAPALAVQDPERERLERQKLEEEIAKLQRDQGFVAQLPLWIGVVTAAVGLGGLVLTLRQYRADRKSEREADVQARKKERLERRREQRLDRRERRRDSVRRFDESFAATVANLGSATPALRASAAASISALLKTEHRAFHDQVFEVFLANVKFPRGDLTDELLARAFAEALRVHLAAHDGVAPLDLRQACLRAVDLSGLDLAGARLAGADLQKAVLASTGLRRVRGESANLTGAILKGANLEEARLRGATLVGARFGGARLVSAKLQGAHAHAARFDGALLQDAHFEDADLRGARFRGATLTNAYFQRAQFDDVALSDLAGNATLPWEHFEDDVQERLEKIGGRAPTGTPPPTTSVRSDDAEVN